MERAPDEDTGFGGIVDAVLRADAAGAAAVEEKAFGDDVGSVEAGDAEGDDVVEGCGGADVDEADDAGGEGGDDDGVDGDGCACLYLVSRYQCVGLRLNPIVDD